MKNLLALLAFGVLLFGTVGWFRGWYQVNSTPTDTGQNRVIIDFNTQKVKQDLDAGREKLKKILDTETQKGEPESKAAPAPATPSASTPATPAQPADPSLQRTQDGFFVLPAQPNSSTPAKQPGLPEPEFDWWFFPQGN